MAALDAGGATPDDERLRLAVDLFIGSGFEPNPYATFLLRITVLEVLADKPSLPRPALDAIDGWIEEVGKLDASGLLGDLAESLKGSLRYLRTRSISKSLKELVRAEMGNGDAERVGELYTLRNDMVHKGRIPDGSLHGDLQDLTRIAKTVLFGRLRAEHS